MRQKYTWRILGLMACLLFGLVAVSCHKEKEITEEQARIVIENAEVVMDNVSKIYEASETVEEMAQHLDEIKAMANVEDAWQDDIAICVKIKDGGIIMWCYYPEEEVGDTINVDSLFNSIITFFPSKSGALCEEKSVCVLNVLYNNLLLGNVRGYERGMSQFRQIGYRTEIKKNEEVTPSFLVDSMPTYGVTFINTHGLYSGNQHWLQTGISFKSTREVVEREIEEAYKLWKLDLFRYILYENKTDAFLSVSENYLDKRISKKFHNNSVIFLDACETLKGNESLWLKLKDKGLGCLLGYTETVGGVFTAKKCCLTFMKEMLDGKTASEACATARNCIFPWDRIRGLNLLCYPINSDITLLEKEDWVDLGLPSGLLWATRNVGATSPEDYGDYFAWGETTPKSVYSWSTYIYCNGDSNQLTKYCFNSVLGYNGFTDTLTILQPGDDAATANYGGRTPTKEEWQELMNNTTSSWVTQNGVNGQRFTGSNGNSLFLPAAGYYHSNWDSLLVMTSVAGGYWSSSLRIMTANQAWGICFTNSVFPYISISYRKAGNSVRAVRSAR